MDALSMSAVFRPPATALAGSRPLQFTDVIRGADKRRVMRPCAMTAYPADVFVINSVDHLPTFCAFAWEDNNPSAIAWIDFWAVEPYDSDEGDYVRGQRYADEAIGHVRITGQRVFIECVLIYMAIKLREDDRCACGLEYGFIDRIAGHFPGSVDNALARALRHHPQALN
jgi:hypothetical protein